MALIDPLVLERKMFGYYGYINLRTILTGFRKEADDGRTPGACLSFMITYELSAQEN